MPPPKRPIVPRFFDEDTLELIKAKDQRAAFLDSLEAFEQLRNVRTVEPLIQALQDIKMSVRREAVKALGQLGDPRAVEPLIQALEDEASDVRREAARALGQLGDARAIEPLIQLLKDSNWEARREAAKALGQLGDTRAIEALIYLLGDGSSELRPIDARTIRGEATEALEKLCNEHTMRFFIKALEDSNSYIRAGIAEILQKKHWNPSNEVEYVHYLIAKQAWENLVSLGSSAVAPLIEVLKDKDSHIREQVTKTLGYLGDTRAVEPLIQLLADWFLDVRKQVAETLGHLGDTRAIEPLIQALQHDRKEAVSALVKLGDVCPIEIFIKALEDSNSYIRAGIAEILQKKHWNPSNEVEYVHYLIAKQAWENLVSLGSSAVAPLIKILKDEDSYIRKEAIKALGQLGDTRAIEPLIYALQDENSGVRWRSAEALGQLGDVRAVEPLIQTLGDDEPLVRGQATLALGQLGDTRAIEPLIQSLQDEDSDVRRKAAGVLEKLYGASTTGFFIKALEDKNSDIRMGVAEVLQRRDWKPSNEVEYAYYLVARQEWKNLVSLGLSVVEPLIKVLKDEDSHIRKEAIKVLGQLGDNRAVEPLINALEDENREVREKAIETLKIICALIDTIIFGASKFKVTNQRTTLLNPNVSKLTIPMPKLTRVMVHSEMYDYHQINFFITYAFEYLGEEQLKKQVEVHIYGDPNKLNRNLYNVFTNNFKSVEIYHGE